MLGRLVVATSHYTIGNLLVTLGSLVSFPILTRILTVEDYGALNLIASLLAFWVGLGKLGVQQAITRFRAEAVAGRNPIGEPGFVSTVLIGMALTGLGATAGFALMAYVVPPAWWSNDEIGGLLLPVSLFVIVRVLDSAVNNLLRAQERSILFNVYAVAKRYIGLGCLVLVMFLILPGLPGFYLSAFVSEALLLTVIAVYMIRRYQVSSQAFSAPTYRSMLEFGMPLIALELSSIALILGDRFVIQSMMDSKALGQYSAAYNLCQYVQMIIFASVGQAVTPIYTRMWEEQGEAATRRFVERAMRFYFMIGCAAVAGMSAVGTSLLTTLASNKYEYGGIVIPFVITSMCIDQAVCLFGAGMFIFKRNRLIIPFVAAAAMLNIILDFLLIPHIGLLGPGVATLLSYLLIDFAAWKIGSRGLRVRIPVADIAKFAVLAAIMYIIVVQVSLPNRALNILAQVAVGIAVYTSLLLAVDGEARQALAWVRTRVMAKLGGARV